MALRESTTTLAFHLTHASFGSWKPSVCIALAHHSSHVCLKQQRLSSFHNSVQSMGASCMVINIHISLSLFISVKFMIHIHTYTYIYVYIYIYMYVYIIIII